MASPLDTHWRAVKRILRYLSGTLDFGIQINKSNGILSAFSDSDWAADLDDRRSTTGFCTYFGRTLISWCVKKQTVVARSSTEVEYRSLAHTASEVTWLRSLLTELKIPSSSSAPVLYVDNLSAIALASNPVLHARTKHIELDIHFVRDKVLNKEIELRHVPTQDQIADVFTKPLGQQPFTKLRSRLGVVSLASLRLRGDVRGFKLQELKEEHASHADMAACIAGKETARDAAQGCVGDKERARDDVLCESMGSKPLPVVANESGDHARTFKEVLLRGLK